MVTRLIPRPPGKRRRGCGRARSGPRARTRTRAAPSGPITSRYNTTGKGPGGECPRPNASLRLVYPLRVLLTSSQSAGNPAGRLSRSPAPDSPLHGNGSAGRRSPAGGLSDVMVVDDNLGAIRLDPEIRDLRSPCHPCFLDSLLYREWAGFELLKKVEAPVNTDFPARIRRDAPSMKVGARFDLPRK